jgi:UDPglucose 6-dehydrogenase
MITTAPLTHGDLPETPTLSVIGCGYLGAVHAAAMASLGFDVIGVEVNPHAASLLAAGTAPFHEAGLPELLRAGVDSGRLAFTQDIREAAAADVHFICVGTPQLDASGAADLSHVVGAVNELAGVLDKPALIVGKSTVPAGTAQMLREHVAMAARPGLQVELIWNPEFLRESKAVADTLHPDRIVLGGTTEASLAVMERVYEAPLQEGIPLVVTDLVTAELVKTAANAFLATKISFINAVAEMCEAVGGDVADIADAIGYDPRIGRQFLNSGVGFGGGCLPKDIRALRHRAMQVGGSSLAALLDDVDLANLRRRERVVELVAGLASGQSDGATVAVLGAAFKANTDDVRDSPALAVARELHRIGVDVRVYDPQATANARRYAPELTFAASMGDAVRGAGVVLVLTEWDEFTSADPQGVASLVASRVLVDARTCMPADDWVAAGWTVHGLGRPSREPLLTHDHAALPQ